MVSPFFCLERACPATRCSRTRMMRLLPEDQQHSTAAQGYMDPGMFLYANDELEKIDSEVRDVPEILAVRVQIYRELEKWPLMQTVAKRLAIGDPGNAR